MQQSKAYVIKNATRNLKATIAARKAEYAAYRYGGADAAYDAALLDVSRWQRSAVSRERQVRA
jgi:hypothetical protein